MMAQVTMASIVNFNARLQVCNNIMPLANLTALHLRYWQWLYNRLTSLSKKRNEIAHFTIVEWTDVHGKNGVYRLVPYFSMGRLVLDTGEGLSLAQVRERGETFNTLMYHTSWLRAEVQVLRGIIGANPIPTPDRVRELDTPDDQTPKETPPPRQP